MAAHVYSPRLKNWSYGQTEMWFEMFIAALLSAIGSTIFGQFEEKTPLWRRLLKIGIFFGITAVLSWTAGRSWALVWAIGLPLLGLSFHIWWCKKHGIRVLSAEPREKYYELRGWK